MREGHTKIAHQQRKEMKKAARKSIRQNYWILLVFCLLAAITGVEFSGTLDFMSIEKADILNKNFITIYENSSDIKFFESKIEKNTALENMIVKDIKAGDDKAADKKVDEIQESLKNDKQRGVFGHSRGIFAKLANNIDSRQYLLQSAQALNHIIKSPSMVGAIITFGALIYQILIGIFIYNVLAVIIRRIFLESRLYTEVALNRGLFLVRSKCWLKAVKTTLLKSIFLFLWMFTVIGYFIKHYSYLLVPFIVAENPQIPASKTITLSREMMDGYKWQAFVMHLSLLGWILLGTLTLGLSNLFFGNMYKTAAFTEFYVKRREDYLKQNSEARNLLKDTYLYEYADKNTLNDAYDDVIKVLNERQKPPVERSGISGFFAKNLGVVLRKTALDQAYSEQQEIKRYLKNFNAALEGTAYPTRLAPIINKERLKILSKNNYMRRYAILNLFLIFIITCMIGWTYEVSIHLIRDGNFVNRGTMHGPWLPIYGYGAVLIIMLLTRLRNKPIFEFLSAVLVSGCIEYLTSWYLEVSHDGMRWWDYSGYFLNINGRCCAEGLLVFGIGGMIAVYLLLPMLDTLLDRIKPKIKIAVAIILLLCYVSDVVYSHYYPNMGKGITDYGTVTVTETVALNHDFHCYGSHR